MNKVSWEQALQGQAVGLTKEAGPRLFSFGFGGAGKSRSNIPKNPNRLSTSKLLDRATPVSDRVWDRIWNSTANRVHTS